jgi:hypothetical protein
MVAVQLKKIKDISFLCHSKCQYFRLKYNIKSKQDYRGEKCV